MWNIFKYTKPTMRFIGGFTFDERGASAVFWFVFSVVSGLIVLNKETV